MTQLGEYSRVGADDWCRGGGEADTIAGAIIKKAALDAFQACFGYESRIVRETTVTEVIIP